jgi:GDP-4-dehydro-6-deoxy-D-mannose reductase
VTTAASNLPLVTGATGFAGSHLLDRLLESQPEVAAWSNARGRQAPPAPRGVRWSAVDLLDPVSVERAVRELQPSVIFHLAGLPHVAESWKSADRALQVNALGTYHLLDAVQRTAPGCRVVVAGSALVYRPSDRALSEGDPVAPSDPYGVSKLAQEMIAARASTPVVRTRPFNHAGPRQSDAFVTSSFARQLAEIEAGIREPVLRVGNLDARRDIMDVRDTAAAYEALAATGSVGGVYNICSGTAHRVGDLLEQLLGLARVKVTVQPDPARLRPSDIPIVLCDPTRLMSDTTWRIRIPIEQTLADLLAWWRTQTAAGQ